GQRADQKTDEGHRPSCHGWESSCQEGQRAQNGPALVPKPKIINGVEIFVPVGLCTVFLSRPWDDDSVRPAQRWALPERFHYQIHRGMLLFLIIRTDRPKS